MLRWRCQYFYWIPLSEVQDQSKYHLDRMSRTCILNLFHMWKVNLIYPTCIRNVPHTPKDVYIFEILGFNYTQNLWRHFSSPLDGDGATFLVLRLGLLGATSWWSILDEMSWGCVIYVVGWPYDYFASWTILLIAITPPLFISLFNLSCINLLVCSVYILL